MKLRPHHVALLTPLERKVYAPFLGDIDFAQEKRDLFVSQSHRYVPGDENVLPFPERSKRGIMLYTLSQHLAAGYTDAAAVYAPKAPHNILHIKRKLLALGAERAYAVPPYHLLAAVNAHGKSPFRFFREPAEFTLKNVCETLSSEQTTDTDTHSTTNTDTHNTANTDNANNVVCALNPPAATIAPSSEYEILGVLLKLRAEASSEPDLRSLPLFAEAAHLGLTDVADIGHDRYWLTPE